MSPHKPVLSMDELKEIAKGSDKIAEWARSELEHREAIARGGRKNKKYHTEEERKAAKRESQRKWRAKKMSEKRDTGEQCDSCGSRVVVCGLCDERYCEGVGHICHDTTVVPEPSDHKTGQQD